MRFEGKNRWQYQGPFEKFMRWLYFIVPWYPRAAYKYIGARLGVFEPQTAQEIKCFQTRRLYAKHLWTTCMAEARYEAGHYYTSEEMITIVNRRRDNAKPSTDSR